MTTNEQYDLERDSQITCVLRGGESIGGILGHPIQLTLDQIDDEYFGEVKSIIDMIQARNFAKREFEISGDFEYSVEIGPKNARPQDLTTIYASAIYECIPSHLLQLQKTLENGMRVADGRAPKP